MWFLLVRWTECRKQADFCYRSISKCLSLPERIGGSQCPNCGTCTETTDVLPESCQWHLEWLLMCCAGAQVMVKTHQVVSGTGTTDVDWIGDMLSLPWSFAPVGHAWPQSLLTPHWRGCNTCLFLQCFVTQQVLEDWYVQKYLRVVLASVIFRVSGECFQLFFILYFDAKKPPHKQIEQSWRP